MALPEETDPPPRKLTFKAAEFISENQPTDAPATDEAMDLLRVNREHEIEHGLVELSPQPAKKFSRRNREYLVVLAAGNCICGGMLLMGGGVFALALLGLFNGGLTWVMLFIFDDY